MRSVLIAIYRISLLVSVLSLVYLLFIFGHTETAPLLRILAACVLTVTGALVAGVLQWVGLPADPKEAPPKKGAHGASHRSK